MDRRFLYPGTFDDVHDDLQIEQNVLLALGAQALSLLGNNNNPQSSTYPTVLAGFIPTVAGLVATFGPGAVYAQQAVDATAFGVVLANTQNTYQQGLSAGFQYSVTVPGTGGQSRNDLIQFFTKQLDTDLVVMPYFNANQPSVPFSGPNNSNNPNYQNRRQVVQIAITLGVAATTGTQTTPAGTAGFLLNYGVTNCTTPLTPPVSAPTLAPTAGGSIPAGSYRAVITYSNAQGETTASPESTTLTTVSTGSIVVTGGAVPAGATQVNVYLYPTGTSSSGSEVYASNYNGGTSTTLTALPAVGAVAYPQLTNFVGGYVVTSANGQSALTLGNITTPTNAPWLAGLNQQHHLGLPGTAPKINLPNEVQGLLPAANFTPATSSTLGGVQVPSPGFLAVSSAGLLRNGRFSRIPALAVAFGLVLAPTSFSIPSVAVGTHPFSGAFDGTSIWIANKGANTVSKINPVTNTVTATVPVGVSPDCIAFDGTSIWVTNSTDGTVNKINPTTNTVTATVTVGSGPVGIAFDGTSIWVANNNSNTVSKINPATNVVTATVTVGTQPVGVVSDGTSVWVANEGGTASKINPSTNAVIATVTCGTTPYGIEFDGSSVWVANSGANNLSKIDPSTNTVTATVSIGGGTGVTSVVFDGTSIWSVNSNGTVTKVDPHTNAIIATITVGGTSPQFAVFDGNSIWVCCYASNAVYKVDCYIGA